MSSDNQLIEWFEQLLFGGSSTPPPYKLKRLILRMQVEDIPWSHIMEQGGFTAFAYQIHGDLNYLTDYLEKQWIDQVPVHAPRPFQTRAVSKFWDELQLLISRRDAKRIPPLPVPSLTDDDILKRLLEGQNTLDEYNFENATFWGGVARRFINLHRPEKVSPSSTFDDWKRVLQLYDVTCKARGQWFDPLSMVLVPIFEYVNAAHYQTPDNLEAFMRDRPSHPLTVSVQTMLKKSLHQLMHGDKPSALHDPCPRLDALLHNVSKIHENIQQVPHDDAPPKLIDVIQRLLALNYRDGLWEKEVPPIPDTTASVGTSLLYLTEQLRMYGREKHLLWQHVTERDEIYAPEQQEHTCVDYLYARDKYRYG